MCLSAGITVALDRFTSLGGWQRWLPEWLPESSSTGIAWLRRCSPTATVISGRIKIAGLAPGRKPSHADEHLHPKRSANPHGRIASQTQRRPDARHGRAQTGSVDLMDKTDCRECCSRRTPSGKGFATLWPTRNGRSGSPTNS
jgi:hypothetical protein